MARDAACCRGCNAHRQQRVLKARPAPGSLLLVLRTTLSYFAGRKSRLREVGQSVQGHTANGSSSASQTRNLKLFQLLRTSTYAAVCCSEFFCRMDAQIPLRKVCSPSHILGPLAFCRDRHLAMHTQRASQGLRQPGSSRQKTRCFLTDVRVSPCSLALFPAAGPASSQGQLPRSFTARFT